MLTLTAGTEVSIFTGFIAVADFYTVSTANETTARFFSVAITLALKTT